MKQTTSLFCVFALSSLTLAAIAQGPPPPAAPGPSMPRIPGRTYARVMVVGPKDSPITRQISGKMAIMGHVENGVNASSVDFSIDGQSFGKSSTPPFKADLDTTTLPDGQHTIKAAGLDTNGKEVWTASSKVIVRNSGEAPEVSVTPVRPTSPVRVNEVPPTQLPVVPVAATNLGQTYTSKRYKFSINYPSAWAASDETKRMTPRFVGGCWIIFGNPPVTRATVVVNVRRQKLEKGTDADIYARYNDYVTKWDRKTISGYPAFTTISGSPESRRVIHRAIIIREGYAWMLNCTDTSPHPVPETGKIFEEMVDSFSTGPA